MSSTAALQQQKIGLGHICIATFKFARLSRKLGPKLLSAQTMFIRNHSMIIFRRTLETASPNPLNHHWSMSESMTVALISYSPPISRAR